LIVWLLQLVSTFTQRENNDVYVGAGDQFGSVDPAQQNLGDLLPRLLLKFHRRDVLKIEIGLGLLRKTNLAIQAF
jgi:hypothetical protein